MHAVENHPRCWGAVAVLTDEDEFVACYPDLAKAEAAIAAAVALASAPDTAEPLTPEQVEERLAEMRANPPTRRPLPGWPG